MPPKRALGAAKKPAAPAKKAPAKGATTKAASTSQKPEAKAAPAAPAVPETKRVIKTIPAKQIAKVLIEDDTEEIRPTKRAVLVIDNEARMVGRSMQYLGGNILEAADPSHMDPERLRKALIGAIKFNKPLTIDLADCSKDMVDVLEQKFNEIQKDLFSKCLNRDVCTKAVYDSLLRPGDDEQYKVADYLGDDFEEFTCKKFQFQILLKPDAYPDDFKSRFNVVTVE